jgi:hypothetical protein
MNASGLGASATSFETTREKNMNAIGGYAIGGYIAEMHGAVARAGWRAVLLLPGWFALPFVMQSLLHPLDVVKLDHLLHGFPLPHTALARQLTVAFAETAVVLAAICLWQLVVTVAFYRKAQIFGVRAATPPLYPMAALLVGGFGNLGWFIGTGSFDSVGFVIGLTSAALTIGIEMLCEQLGRDFVLGVPTGFHPPV